MSIIIDSDLPLPGECYQWRVYSDGSVTVGDGEHEDQIHEAREWPGWISVKDRLPEATEPDVRGNIVFSSRVLSYRVFDDGYSCVSPDVCHVMAKAWLSEAPGEAGKVTHWMPLPEPPEEVSE